MSSRIRQLMRMRQDAMLAAAQNARPIDLDQYREGLQEQLQDAVAQDQLSPVPLGRETLEDLYGYLLAPSMASQIVDQYARSARNTIQNDFNQGDPDRLMRPMISSVVQLDR